METEIQPKSYSRQSALSYLPFATKLAPFVAHARYEFSGKHCRGGTLLFQLSVLNY